MPFCIVEAFEFTIEKLQLLSQVLVAKTPVINPISHRAIRLLIALAFALQQSAAHAQKDSAVSNPFTVASPGVGDGKAHSSDFKSSSASNAINVNNSNNSNSTNSASNAFDLKPTSGKVSAPPQAKAKKPTTSNSAVTAVAGPSKSVSMATPPVPPKADTSALAPPMQPKLDTSVPTKNLPGQPALLPGSMPAPFPSTPASSKQTFPGQGSANGLSGPNNSLIPLGGAPSPGSPASPTASASGEDNYPVIGTLETSIFGASTPTVVIDDRLAKLETAVYKKTFASETLFDRTERLKATLLGLQSSDQDPNAPGGSSRFIETAGAQGASYFDAIAALPENQTEVSVEELQRYFFVLVNGERQKFGYAPLAPDEIATKLAETHASELSSRRVMSHQDLKGNNPDRRYTLAGGTDLLYESIVSINNDTGAIKPTRAIAVNLLKTIMNRQDEREALMASDATGLGFAIGWTKDKDKIVGCSDVLTRHGVLQPIPNVVQVGEKIDVKGVIMPPFHFDKITVAWEGPTAGLSTVADDSEEALPYFAPLDYTAFAHHSDNDHQGTITALKAAGIIAAIGGGVFFPPIALAAPMIAMSGSMTEPKPASDIPIKGGVKVDGNAFDGKVSINHEGKEGIYYITVWASLTKYGKPLAISRRAILATSASAGDSRAARAQAKAEGNANSKPNTNDVQAPNASPTLKATANPDGTFTPKDPKDVDTEKVSAQVVNDDGTAETNKPGKVAKTKHKHKQAQNFQDPNQ